MPHPEGGIFFLFLHYLELPAPPPQGMLGWNNCFLFIFLPSFDYEVLEAI